jgi:hypothetical protein
MHSIICIAINKPHYNLIQTTKYIYLHTSININNSKQIIVVVVQGAIKPLSIKTLSIKPFAQSNLRITINEECENHYFDIFDLENEC